MTLSQLYILTELMFRNKYKNDADVLRVWLGKGKLVILVKGSRLRVLEMSWWSWKDWESILECQP